jgi:hypothetical protein
MKLAEGGIQSNELEESSLIDATRAEVVKFLDLIGDKQEYSALASALNAAQANAQVADTNQYIVVRIRN